MKKQEIKQSVQVSDPYFKKHLFIIFLYSLILPTILKVFIDIPTGVADYICNSYAGVYPTATTIGLVSTQILTVLAEMLRAGFIGCVLCALLYAIGKNHKRTHIYVYLTVVLVSPLCVSAVGMALNYLCVLAGLSRDMLYFFEAKLPQLIMAALIEYLLYAVLIVCSVLILYWVVIKKTHTLFEDSNGFFPTASLYRVVTVAIALFGVISLAMTVSDMVVDLRNYANITSSLSGVMGYLVLPYLYLILKLAAMLFLSAMLYRRLDRQSKTHKETKI